MIFDICKKLCEAAHDAVVREVMTTPKPGLVDRDGNGCHDDMDWKLFVKSANAIFPFWHEQAEVGLSGVAPERALLLLRQAGIRAENAMFKATNGINTHKGLIYLMSLLLYGAGYCVSCGRILNCANITKNASDVVKGTVECELAPLLKRMPKRKLSNGEVLFVNYGIKGIRGEAEEGYPSVVNFGLPAYRKALSAGATQNDAGISSLLCIMSNCCDSNVIHRAGYEYAANTYHHEVLKAAKTFNPIERNYEVLYELEKSFLPHRASPGGAADLLSCTYFINAVEKEII